MASLQISGVQLDVHCTNLSSLTVQTLEDSQFREGNGRSYTMACTELLTKGAHPPPQRLSHGYRVISAIRVTSSQSSFGARPFAERGSFSTYGKSHNSPFAQPLDPYSSTRASALQRKRDCSFSRRPMSISGGGSGGGRNGGGNGRRKALGGDGEADEGGGIKGHGTPPERLSPWSA
eukprot:TRINITY_DN9694_c0_g1_i1.p1 TRINITY_DN9694_c0_g1~~TRINITY_DN9694_c0_g1_i1.p1  ORF type:complete len:177 (+),score=9.88 TRINITY_DN9694_c0_g1_i1:38-568(+)